MARIHDDDIRRLKENVSLADLCRSRGIELKQHGSRDYIGRCPFHPDENPSFVVTPSKNLFHCLGCDAAGSVIDFVMKLDGLTFREAVDQLLAAGPKVRRASEIPPSTARSTVSPEHAQELLERVVTLYEKNFTESGSGRAYLAQRGLTDHRFFTQHRIGFSDGSLLKRLPPEGEVVDALKALGVLLENGHERFSGCVVFPIFDENGEIATLYGRYTKDSAKRHVFLPDRPTGLWNVAAIKSFGELILVESVLDALSVMVAGFENVVSIQGTNGFPESAIQLLRQHGVQSLILLLDGDEPGQQAALRLKGKISSSLRCRLLTLPDGEDPNSFLTRHGPEKLAAWLNERLSAGEPGKPVPAVRANGDGNRGSPASLIFPIGARRYEIYGLEKGPRKLKATIRVEHAGRLHVDTLDLYGARGRKALGADLCRLFAVPPEDIEADLCKLIRHCEAVDLAPNDPNPTSTMSAAERQEAETFGKRPDLLEAILRDFELCGLVGEKFNKPLCYLAMVSRRMDEPLSVLILSSSGAGKTALQDTALLFCPPEDLLKLTSLSGKALFYKERLSLKHKVLALEEGAGAEEASYAIRNLISARELVIESAIKDPLTGKITTMENRVEGRTSVFLTTTDPDTDAETKSRFFVTSVDESKPQTRAILAFQRTRQTLAGWGDQARVEEVLRKHRNFQRLLKPLAVINPYADQLTYGDDRLQGRRDQPKYLNLIKAVAFLRQMRKPIQTRGGNGTQVEYIEVDVDDIRIANELAHEILGHSLDELSRPGRDLLLLLDDLLKERTQDSEDAAERRSHFTFTRRDIREFTGWANSRVHRYLRELVDLEYVLVESGRNGATYRYRLAYDGQGKDGQRFVLGLKAIADLKRKEGP